MRDGGDFKRYIMGLVDFVSRGIANLVARFIINAGLTNTSPFRPGVGNGTESTGSVCSDRPCKRPVSCGSSGSVGTSSKSDGDTLSSE